MKNIETILKDVGIVTSDEQLKNIKDQVSENYKTISDYNKQTLKLETAEENVKTLTSSLDKFKDINVDEMNTTIENLKSELTKTQAEAETKISDMAFDNMLSSAIISAKGKDVDVIKRNLDINALKSSKNQSEDIKNALKTLADNELTKAFFGTESESNNSTRGTFPIRVSSNMGGNSNTYLDDMYKNNPYYHPNN